MSFDPGAILLFAHALAARDDLPIPEWLFAWAASFVLIVSFFAFSVAWKRPRFEEDDWRPLGGGLSKALLGPATQALCGLGGIFLLGVTVYAGLEGTAAPDRNFALTFVFVTVWLGFPLLSVLFGDVFRAFNPWRAIGRAGGAVFSRLVGQAPAHASYPERLGRWPAAAGLAAFVWLEVVYGASSGIDPETTAIACVVYTAYTLAMMVLFGAEKWCERGEVFSVYFGMFSQLSPLEARDGRIGRRRAFSAAPRWATLPGSVALVLVSIGTTSFDGAQEGALKDAVESTFTWFADRGLALDTALRVTDTIYLVVCLAAVSALYLGGVAGMLTRRGAPSWRTLRDGFAHTLIPIALAYLFAHYFSLFVFQEQAQFTYLLSDPLGTGTTDLFGTASSGVDYGLISANAVWYVQVAALVIGHVIGLMLAHDRAIAFWGDYREATRSQYYMLSVMVGFTCLGLYLLSSANS